MQKGKLFVLLLLIAIIVASCKSVSYMSRSVDINRNDANQTPMNAELSVNLNQKVTAVSDMQETKKAAISSAYYNCIKANDIDVVVDPIIKITKYSVFVSRDTENANNAKWWVPQYKAEILGYGGKYVKIETTVDQVNQFEHTDMNTIVKYKMVTSPDFYKSYYNNQKSNVVNIYGDNQPTKKTYHVTDPNQNKLKAFLSSLKPTKKNKKRK